MLKALNNYKTYIGLIAAGLFGIAAAQGWVSLESPMWQSVAAAIGTWTGVGITHKVQKAIDKL